MKLIKTGPNEAGPNQEYHLPLILGIDVNLVFVRYFDEMYVVSPLVVLCDRRLHDTSPLFGPRGRHWEVISR